MSESQRVDALVARIEQLEAHIERLERDRDEGVAGTSTSTNVPVSRRRLLGMAGVAAAGAAGAAIATAAPAGAGVDGDLVLGAVGQSVGALGTGLTSTNSSGTLQVGNTASGPAIRADSTSGIAVFALSTSDDGVRASSTNNNSLRVMAPTANTAGAHVLLQPGSIGAPPTGGAHLLGQFWMDSAGVLFQCVVAGTGLAATWQRQAPLVTLVAPSRVYDSRTGQPNPSGSPQGTLAFGAAARTINCSPAVPSGATTILFNLAATGTAGPGAGALLVWAAGATEPLASSINWSSAGQTLANGVTSACDASQDVQVKCVASTGSSTHFLLDVIGYYR